MEKVDLANPVDLKELKEPQPRLVVGEEDEKKEKNEQTQTDVGAVKSKEVVPVTPPQTVDGLGAALVAPRATDSDQAAQERNFMRLLITPGDIVGFIFIAVCIIGYMGLTATTVMNHMNQGGIANSLYGIFLCTGFLFLQSYWLRDIVTRLHRVKGDIDSRWGKIDRLASINPIIIFSSMVIFTGLAMIAGAKIFATLAAPFILVTGIILSLRWLFLVFSLPFKTSKIANPDTPKTNQAAVLLACTASILSMAPIFILFAPDAIGMFNGAIGAIFGLFLSACTFIGLRNAIIDIDPQSQLDPKILERERLESQEVAAGDMVLGYNHFVELQRFVKQRVALGSPWKTGFLALILVAAAAGQLHTHILEVITKLAVNSGILPSTMVNKGPNIGAIINDPNALANSGLVAFFMFCAFALITTVARLYIKAPRRLVAGKNGVKLTYMALAKRKADRVLWDEVSHIKVVRPPGKASAASDKLIFERHSGPPLVLKLAGIASTTDREKLLSAIDRYAPHISREAAIEETLRKPTEHNYTELWLQALAAPPKREKLKPLMAGAVINEERYRIGNVLGVGGQGFAYLATDARTDKEVVLKEFVLPVFVDINARRSSLENFEKEAKLMTRLDHPQVVKLDGFFVEDHRAYLVLEHIDGENLRQIVERDGPMSEERIKELAAQMCAILSYLHGLSPPLVHRDFTPDNLILRKDGTLKLIDFNVAQQVEVAVTGTVVGKQSYLPPEQFRGQAEPASDLYAFGATLYFLAGGKDPTPISVAKPIKDGLPVSAEFDALVSAMTQMDPSLRPASAQAVADLLRAGETTTEQHGAAGVENEPA